MGKYTKMEKILINKKSITQKGLLAATCILCLWFVSLIFLLNWEINLNSPIFYLGILIQTHLYTGLFITTHDSIHGVVAPQFPKLNRWIGILTASLFAFNNYWILEKKHHQHHDFVNTDKDPDVHQGNFFLWWFKFIFQYVTWKQVLLMAITYNILKIWIPMWNLILFWELPAILGTLQLFYFGTFIPHKGEFKKENIYQSRSQKLNHFASFISCYFFGYHYEHHAFPYLPWWKLPKAKEELMKNSQINY